MVDMGKKLRGLRTANNLSQAQLAERLGVTKALISSYENDLRQQSYENLLKLSRIFKVTTDWMLGNTTQGSFDFSSLTEEQTALVIGIIKEFEKANGN